MNDALATLNATLTPTPAVPTSHDNPWENPYTAVNIDHRTNADGKTELWVQFRGGGEVLLATQPDLDADICQQCVDREAPWPSRRPCTWHDAEETP